MSVITRTRRLNDRPLTTPNVPPSVPKTTIRSLFAEAPERAAVAPEAPESYRGRTAEAPDAGVRRGGDHEREFTRGRSQS